MKLKTLSKEGVEKALAKAERYRFLNDPSASESICQDILAVEPNNQAALVMLILSLTDQFDDRMHRVTTKEPLQLLQRLTSDYQRTYYRGIVCERWAKSLLTRGNLGAESMAYDFLREAMDWYQKAEAAHEVGNDETILRWNSCVRCIESHKLKPHEPGEGSQGWHD